MKAGPCCPRAINVPLSRERAAEYALSVGQEGIYHWGEGHCLSVEGDRILPARDAEVGINGGADWRTVECEFGGIQDDVGVIDLGVGLKVGDFEFVQVEMMDTGIGGEVANRQMHGVGFFSRAGRRSGCGSG